MAYSHLDLEEKWQSRWKQADCFKADNHSNKPKYYALDMFPYPSGAGLHVGHLASYTPTDIVARYKRTQGFNVLHPMGYDAFGLPAEQYAIQTGIHPAETTRKAIENFRRQLQSFGYSFDWDREISTAEPEYYKWTQFIFLKLFERGLAYQKEVPVNWCPALRTVLANEEVVDGKSERGGHPVIRMPMKQWMLNITAYAERLLNDLDKLDWPERTKEGQRNWIGKSVGAKITFPVADSNHSFEVFTTRPDTLFGVSFMVLAPEHPLVAQITTAAQKSAVDQYVEKTKTVAELERKSNQKKTGVFTGAYATHPFTQAKIPIWIADYVLMDYGTGAIMAVPGHDARDFEFAQTFNLPVLQVLASDQPLPFEGDGQLINSDFLNGLSKPQAIEKMVSEIEKRNLGERQVQYKLRDWLFSRQRYWGEPFPIVHTDQGPKAVPYTELPVVLPKVANYEPSEKGEPPLARVPEFVNYPSGGRRDTDTMPGTAASAWYFLRYTDPKNKDAPFSFEAQKYWMPVDLYVGGTEHTVSHLLYMRFWQKVLFDAGLTSYDEPVQKLAHQGVIMGPDGQRMSKSRGNVVNPDDVRKEYGADATRAYICFLGPFDKDKPWATNGIDGVRRFLDRVWRLVVDENGNCAASDSETVPEEFIRLHHKTIKKVQEDYETMGFNTVVSALMIWLNELYKLNIKPKALLLEFCQLLAPIAPHLCEEMWEKLGGKGFVSTAAWPKYNPDLAQSDVVTMAVQVNGKTRGTIEVSLNATEEQVVALAKQISSVQNALNGVSIIKIIYKAGKILNLIAK